MDMNEEGPEQGSRKEITDILEEQGVRRTQWFQGKKEDGSSSRSWLHEKEEEWARRAKNLSWGLVKSIPGRNRGIGQEREAVPGSGPIGFELMVSYPHGCDGIIRH